MSSIDGENWGRPGFNDFLPGEWQNLVFSLPIQCMSPWVHTAVIRASLYVYLTFYFWSSHLTHCRNTELVSKFTELTRNRQPKSIGYCLLIFKFHYYILPASENSIRYENLLTRLLLTLVKQLLGGTGGEQRPHKACHCQQMQFIWHRCTHANCWGRSWKVFWNQCMCSKWLLRNIKAGKVCILKA